MNQVSMKSLLKCFLQLAALCTIPLAVTLSGCQKANDVATQIGGPTDKEVKTLELHSLWKTPCVKAGLLLEVFGFPAQKTEMDFGASHSSTTILYREDNCQNAAIRIIENGAYSLGNKVADNVYELNEHYDSVAITPLNADGVNALNTIRACGFTDWNSGVGKDVTAQSSTTPALARCWMKTPRDVFDIVMVTGNVIKFGLEKNGLDKSAPQKRPTEVDQSSVFAK